MIKWPSIPVTGGDDEAVEIPVIIDQLDATDEEIEDMHDFMRDLGGSMPISPKEFLDLHRQGKIKSPHRRAREASDAYDRAMKGI